MAVIQRLTTLPLSNLTALHTQLMELLAPHYKQLAEAGQSLEMLATNALSHLPYLWLAWEGETLLAACYFSDVSPGQSATLHGASSPEARRHPIKRQLASQVLATAFGDELQLSEVIAIFDADNRGAKGFCLMAGFRPHPQLNPTPIPGIQRADGQPIRQLRWGLSQSSYRAALSRGKLPPPPLPINQITRLS